MAHKFLLEGYKGIHGLQIPSSSMCYYMWRYYKFIQKDEIGTFLHTTHATLESSGWYSTQICSQYTVVGVWHQSVLSPLLHHPVHEQGMYKNSGTGI